MKDDLTTAQVRERVEAIYRSESRRIFATLPRQGRSTPGERLLAGRGAPAKHHHRHHRAGCGADAPGAAP